MTPGNTSPPHDHIVGTGVSLGLRQNLAQFMIFVAVNALVGGTLGQEQTALALLAAILRLLNRCAASAS